MRKSNVATALFALLALALAASLPVAAQDFRGSISGTVSDTTGNPLPGVTVTATNTETNVASRTPTDVKGFYQIFYLRPGTYTVAAALSGFPTVTRKDIEVRIGDAKRVDIQMALGQQTTVEVTGAAPILDPTSPVTGQVVDRQQIKELPLADGTAYMLSRVAPGLSETSDLHFSRPADNANLGGVVANGVRGGNDFTLDGAPNIVSTQRVGYSPPSDAIAEFKVETNSFDAQAGHTAGAVVNLTLRSGTNDFHGAASYFNRSSDRSANSPFAKAAGQEVVSRAYDRFTAMISGPIVRDSTFFMGSYEHLKDLTDEPATYTVPTEKMRRGDFSELLPLGILIYDPLTGTTARKAFPGNIIPANRLNPIALAMLNYYPLPNQAGAKDFTQNYYSPQPRTYDYDSALVRLDQTLGASTQLFLNGYWNRRTEDRYNWAGVINNFAVTQGIDLRTNFGGTLGVTETFSPTLIGDLRASASQFGESQEPSQSFDPASLGFSPATVALFRGYQYLPRFDISGFTTMGSQRSNYEQGFNRPFYNYAVAPTATWLTGDHTVRGGYDLRYQRWYRADDGYQAGRYNFTGAYTRLSNSATIQTGQSLAQFLLGIPTSGGNSSIDVNTDGSFYQTNHAFFVNDEWRLTNKLTLNAGLRVELDMGMRESADENIFGFDRTTSNPLEPQAKANYAKNPIPEIPVDQFRVLGGLVYGSGAVYDTIVKPLPRISASYLLTPKTVLKAGVGAFSFPYYFDAINQTGFSQPTLLVSTDNNGATFIADLNNPFPNGLGKPPGSSLGLLTSVGRDLVSTSTALIQQDRKSPYYVRWQAGVQQEFGKGWRAELNYIGSVGRNLPMRRDLNALPLAYVSTKAERDTAQEAYLNQAVPNPYAGMLPGTSFNGATVQRNQLLRAYSEFGRVAVEEYNGRDSYNSAQLSVQKRFSEGSSILATYTYSHLTDQLNYLNPGDPEPEKRISPDDRPHRATVAAIWKLPFGKGRAVGKNWNGILDALFGGWQLSAAYQFQSGQPVLWYTSTSGGVPIWNNIYFNPACDPKDLKSDVGKNSGGVVSGFNKPAWDITCFYPTGAAGAISDPRIAVGEANLRTFPTTLDNVRYGDLHLLDMGLSKSFFFKNFELQIRIEAINALNYVVYFTPDVNPRSATFGYFTTQRNNPRDFQLGARLSF